MLFDLAGSDDLYEILRTSDRPLRQQVRDFYEERWEEFEAFSEPNFHPSIRRSFEEHAWELELGSSLVRRELLVNPQLGRGPDFLAHWGNRQVYIEATCPGPGHAENPDRLPEAPIDDLLGGNVRLYVPAVNQAVLRCTSSINAKVDQYRAFKETAEGRAMNDCGLIVALSGRRIKEHAAHLANPLPLRFLYGAGDLSVDINPVTGAVVREYLEYRPVQLRVAGTEIDSSLFVTGLYPELLGVLWDSGFGDVARRWEQWVFFPRPMDEVPPAFDWLQTITVGKDGTVRGLS